MAEEFKTPHLCMKCGQQGTVTWEAGRQGPVATSSNFYLRVKTHIKEPRMTLDIVCARCGTAQHGETVLRTVPDTEPAPKSLG